MTDPVLKRIWEAREAISRRCGFDARKLVRFYQNRQKAAAQQAKEDGALKKPEVQAAGSLP